MAKAKAIKPIESTPSEIRIKFLVSIGGSINHKTNDIATYPLEIAEKLISAKIAVKYDN